MPIRPMDLPARPAQGVCLRCPCCGEQYSACRSDYFLDAKDEPMVCGACREAHGIDEPLDLVRRVVQFRRVRPYSPAAGVR